MLSRIGVKQDGDDLRPLVLLWACWCHEVQRCKQATTNQAYSSTAAWTRVHMITGLISEQMGRGGAPCCRNTHDSAHQAVDTCVCPAAETIGITDGSNSLTDALSCTLKHS